MKSNIILLFICLLVVFIGVTYNSKNNKDSLKIDMSNTPDTSQTSNQSSNKINAQVSNQPNTQTSQNKMQENTQITYATFHTNKGDIKLQLFADKTPNTVANFLKLAGAGFYNGVKFHRVIKDFMIQGGDPLTKDDSKMGEWGTGGPGYKFADELSGTNTANHNDIGTIAMANAGPNTNGSQFFINVKGNNFLDGKHTVFGKVVGGMDVVTTIENVQTGQNDRPVDAVIIESISLDK